MGIIFSFSAQTGDISLKTSGKIETQIADVMQNQNWIQTENEEEWKDTITFIVRKTAHFTIYTILGISLMGVIGTFEGTYNKKQLWMMAVGIGIVYAMSDELHQKFVSERSAEWRDVGIDTIGVILGTSIMQGIHRFRKNRENKKTEEIV